MAKGRGQGNAALKSSNSPSSVRSEGRTRIGLEFPFQKGKHNMKLQDFIVLHAQPDSDVVMMHAYDGRQLVIAFIPTMHLDDHFRREHLTGR
jgi:hypothetical protein